MPPKKKATASKLKDVVLPEIDWGKDKWSTYDCLEIVKAIIKAKGSYSDDYVDWAIKACNTIHRAYHEQP